MRYGGLCGLWADGLYASPVAVLELASAAAGAGVVASGEFVLHHGLAGLLACVALGSGVLCLLLGSVVVGGVVLLLGLGLGIRQ